MTAGTVMAEVLADLEIGDELTYENVFGQVFTGRVVETSGDRVCISRPDWPRPEWIKADEYRLHAWVSKSGPVEW
jgi:hypothetical protein